jgi:hypothetical protein
MWHDGLLRFARNDGIKFVARMSGAKSGAPLRDVFADFAALHPGYNDSGMASRVARKLEAKAVRATNWHDGQITKNLSSPSRKNILLPPSAKSVVQSRPSTATRGAIAIVTTVRWDAMDAKAATDERGMSVRRSRVVLMPRRWRQVRGKPTLLADDGDNKARSPGRARSKP